jgi:hypothetical protein
MTIADDAPVMINGGALLAYVMRVGSQTTRAVGVFMVAGDCATAKEAAKRKRRSENIIEVM